MSKSKVRKKNGKPVKYTPNPTGISKTKMKKLMELLGEYNKQAEGVEGAIPEIRDRAGSLIIPSEFTIIDNKEYEYDKYLILDLNYLSRKRQ